MPAPPVYLPRASEFFAYTDAIRDRLVEKGAQNSEPLQGLRLGPRLAWYRMALEREEPTIEVNVPHIDAQDLIAALTDGGRAQRPAEFLERNGAGLRSPGLYSWWVDEVGALDLAEGLGLDVRPGLIYTGLAGATRSRSGLKSKNTLWGRIRGMHLGGRHEFSTFRLSLGSILASARVETDIVEDALTVWMHQHLRVLAIPFEDADTLGELESDVLRALDPPLNLDQVAKNPLRTRLSGTSASIQPQEPIRLTKAPDSTSSSRAATPPAPEDSVDFRRKPMHHTPLAFLAHLRPYVIGLARIVHG